MYNQTVLYAEDDNESRENYTYILKKVFSTVYSVSNGEDALQIYTQYAPDIVLLDISMPKIDGLEVATTIRQNDSKTPIIILSAHSDSPRLLQAVNLKLAGYLLKPIDDEQLLTLIEKIINTRLQNNQNIIINKDLVWNKSTKILHYGNKIIKMTKKEILFFECLVENIGAYVHRAHIINYVWEDEFGDETHEYKLTQLAYRFNKKILNETNSNESIIQSIYSYGYKIITN